MLIRFLTSVATLALGGACATAQGTEASAPGWLSKDFAEFVELFEGRWDSDRHVFFADAAGMSTDGIAPRQHLTIERATVSAGENEEEETFVYQATRTVEGEAPVSLIHTLAIDASAGAIRQSMATPGGVLPPASIDCSILWTRSGGQFAGTATGDECASVFPDPADGGDLEVALTLSERDLWVAVNRGENSTEARLRRARPFECWTAILRGASHGDSGQGMNDWDFRRGVKIHDQGGEAELMTDEDEPRRVRLKLRNVDWPYGTNRSSLTLYVMEGDSDRAVSYAWNEADAERIGINLRWIQASCTHTPS